MDKKTKEIIITSILGAFMFILLGKNIIAPLFFSKKYTPPPSTKPPLSIADVQKMIQQKKSFSFSKTALLDKYASMEWDRDPFVLKDLEQRRKGLVLTGIIWTEKTPVAIINDQFVGVGDAIGETKVVDIRNDVVILESEGKRFELKIWKEE